MSPENALTKHGQRVPKWRGLDPYFSLLSVQTVGVAILMANIVPLYRLMVLDFSSYIPDARPWWAIAGIVLAQAAYWFRVRFEPPLPRTRHMVLGHITLFVARICFVSVTASFTTMFLTRFPDLKNLDYSSVRALFILVMFFAIFCWTLELERLAKALRASDGGT